MANKFYPVAQPTLNGNELNYVVDCIKSSWISSTGKYIDQFESKFAEYCKVTHSISVMNGTVALHLALLALDICEGDEIILPTFTYIATANAVRYVGAKPVFVDCDRKTWNINPNEVRQHISSRTKAIIVVHIYGQPCEMEEINAIAKEYGLFVIEDAAEAHGAVYHDKPVGSLSDMATFSFFGNKIITTGEGGMVLTNNDILAEKIRLLKGQGMDPKRRYWFPVIGYNYRMTNVQAAIGLAQLENIQWHVEQRIRVYNLYRKKLSHRQEIEFQGEVPNTKSSYWMTSILVNKNNFNRELFMQRLLHYGIEVRPFFYPMHILPPYQNFASEYQFPIADYIYSRGINLPSYASLKEDDIEFISKTICKLLDTVE